MLTTRCRILATALALCLLLTLLAPALPQGSAKAADALGIVTSSSVHVRRQASRGAEIWFDLNQNSVCTILGEENNEGIHWYKVESTNPETGGISTYIGFIHGDYFRPMTDAEISAYKQSQAVTAATPTPNPNVDTAASSGSLGVVTNGGTNFREGPSTHSYSMMKLDRGTEVELLTVPSVISSDTFYQVRYNNVVGYIMSTFIRVVGGGAAATPTPTPAPGQAATTATATPTPAPSQPTATPVPTDAHNYVRLILSSCHLRETPGGSYDSDNDWLGRGSVLPLAGSPVSSGGYTWYPVSRNGRVWYVRNDCVETYYNRDVTPTPTPAADATATPTPASTSSASALGYVRTTKGGVNLRATIGGTVIKQLKKNLVLPYLIAPVTKNGYTWYYVDADGNRGYLRSDVVKVVSGGTATAAPTAAATSGTDQNATGWLKTTAGGVNLRQKAGYTDTIGRVDRDVVLAYYGTPTTVKSVVWYYVYVPNLGYGYLHGNYVQLVNSDGSIIPTAQPTTTGSSGGSSGNSSGSQQEATYNTLRLGSTGSAVKNLVQELKNQGYFSGSVISRYNSAVEKAVKAFQQANGLTVDGIAGAATQHKLYNTVPVGAADTSNLEMVIYPAEKVDWYKGGINELWPRGSNYKVYDVKTGIVWWAHRWAGGSHVDAEPLTAADTARLCKSYGVTTSQEIKDKNLYQRRPLLVTIGTRTFCCSLYGVPHNYPEGDTISNNDFRGQVCIHFTNSKTHNSNNVDSGHEEAIQYAWEHAPNGHK